MRYTSDDIKKAYELTGTGPQPAGCHDDYIIYVRRIAEGKDPFYGYLCRLLDTGDIYNSFLLDRDPKAAGVHRFKTFEEALCYAVNIELNRSVFNRDMTRIEVPFVTRVFNCSTMQVCYDGTKYRTRVVDLNKINAVEDTDYQKQRQELIDEYLPYYTWGKGVTRFGTPNGDRFDCRFLRNSTESNLNKSSQEGQAGINSSIFSDLSDESCTTWEDCRSTRIAEDKQEKESGEELFDLSYLGLAGVDLNQRGCYIIQVQRVFGQAKLNSDKLYQSYWAEQLEVSRASEWLRKSGYFVKFENLGTMTETERHNRPPKVQLTGSLMEEGNTVKIFRTLRQAVKVACDLELNFNVFRNNVLYRGYVTRIYDKQRNLLLYDGFKRQAPFALKSGDYSEKEFSEVINLLMPYVNFTLTNTRMRRIGVPDQHRHSLTEQGDIDVAKGSHKFISYSKFLKELPSLVQDKRDSIKSRPWN